MQPTWLSAVLLSARLVAGHDGQLRAHHTVLRASLCTSKPIVTITNCPSSSITMHDLCAGDRVGGLARLWGSTGSRLSAWAIVDEVIVCDGAEGHERPHAAALLAHPHWDLASDTASGACKVGSIFEGCEWVNGGRVTSLFVAGLTVTMLLRPPLLWM